MPANITPAPGAPPRFNPTPSAALSQAAALVSLRSDLNGVMQRMAQREAYLPTAFPSTMPPAVADNGMVGGANGNVVAYAFANHTHNSKQRRERVVLTQTGIVTWTYATPYPEGSLPIVQGTPEVLADASQPLVACLVGRPTATQAQFFVYRAQTQTLGGTLAALLGVVVNVFAPAPIGAALHCTAVVP